MADDLLDWSKRSKLEISHCYKQSTMNFSIDYFFKLSCFLVQLICFKCSVSKMNCVRNVKLFSKHLSELLLNIFNRSWLIRFIFLKETLLWNFCLEVTYKLIHFNIQTKLTIRQKFSRNTQLLKVYMNTNPILWILFLERSSLWNSSGNIRRYFLWGKNLQGHDRWNRVVTHYTTCSLEFDLSKS